MLALYKFSTWHKCSPLLSWLNTLTVYSHTKSLVFEIHLLRCSVKINSNFSKLSNNVSYVFLQVKILCTTNPKNINAPCCIVNFSDFSHQVVPSWHPKLLPNNEPKQIIYWPLLAHPTLKLPCSVTCLACLTEEECRECSFQMRIKWQRQQWWWRHELNGDHDDGNSKS